MIIILIAWLAIKRRMISGWWISMLRGVAHVNSLLQNGEPLPRYTCSMCTTHSWKITQCVGLVFPAEGQIVDLYTGAFCLICPCLGQNVNFILQSYEMHWWFAQFSVNVSMILGIFQMVKDMPNIQVGQVDCDANKALCQRVNVRSYPTIRLYPTGRKGSRKFQ